MSAVQYQNMFHDTYKQILGRNVYNQDLRQYVYTSKNGTYYSDCSSSICATMNKIGIAMDLFNTKEMYRSNIWKQVDVSIVDGHIKNADINKLRVGDALMFRGEDPSRPLQIGHVEAIYEINGTTESDITLCGHGFATPALKNMKDYLSKRQSSMASNGKTKGLVCVLRAIASIAGNDTTKKTTIVKTDVKENSLVIKNIQIWCNQYVKAGLGIDGVFGSKTKNALCKALQHFLNVTTNAKLVEDGIFGSATKAKCVTVSGKGDLVYITQAMLYGLGYNLSHSIKNNDLDSIFGTGMKVVITKFQKDKGLKKDGICGPETLEAMFS